MLDELLKHESLGNKRELTFVLFQALTPGKEQLISDITKFCTSHLFSISRSINGILSLLNFLDIITIDKGKMELNISNFNPEIFESPQSYFNDVHFFDRLFKRLIELEVCTDLFNENNLKLSHEYNRYYVKSNLIKFQFFPFRNLLIALNFLEQDHIIPDHYLIHAQFTHFFKIIIIDHLNKYRIHTTKVSHQQLEKWLEQKNEAGEQGELFVLHYEQNRMKGHSSFEKIERISNSYVNAGYDIKSFNDLDSFIMDRFIEVKSYRDQISFYWSKNEVEKAKELSTKYYLYLVDRSLMNKKGYVPKIIQDPYKKIFENELWMKEIENWKITIED